MNRMFSGVFLFGKGIVGIKPGMNELTAKI